MRTQLVVQGDQLAELVGALDDLHDRVGHQLVALAGAREDLEQQQRRVAQIEHRARLDREGGERCRRDLFCGGRDPRRDRLAVLVELVLPQQAGEDGPAQHLLIRQTRDCRRALVRARGIAGNNIQTHVDLLG